MHCYLDAASKAPFQPIIRISEEEFGQQQAARVASSMAHRETRVEIVIALANL